MKKVILVSENFILREKVKRFCRSLREVDLLKVFGDSESSLGWLQFNETDFAIIDFFLFGYDGLDLLRTVQNDFSFQSIFLTPTLSSGIPEQAFSYGASAVLEHSFAYEELKNAFSEERNLDSPSSTCNADLKDAPLDEKIACLCVGVGIPPHISGYHYIREAIKIAILQPKCMNKITKELYPSVAKKFKTTPSKVERAIRHALTVANASEKLENINTLLHTNSYVKGQKITSSQFIALVADRLLFQISLKDL